MVKKIGDFFSRFYFVLVMIFMYAPIAVLIVLSFNSSRSRVVWGGFTLDWYVRLFSNRQIMESLKTTIILALLSSVIATLIGVTAAIGISAMRQRNFRVTMAFTNIPMLNADIVTGIALMLWFVRFMPLGFSSVLIAHITFNIPYVILTVMPKIRQMNVSVYEASRDLGASAVYGFVQSGSLCFPDIPESSAMQAGYRYHIRRLPLLCKILPALLHNPAWSLCFPVFLLLLFPVL